MKEEELKASLSGAFLKGLTRVLKLTKIILCVK